MFARLQADDFSFQDTGLMPRIGSKPYHEDQPDQRHKEDDRRESPRKNTVTERF